MGTKGKELIYREDAIKALLLSETYSDVHDALSNIPAVDAISIEWMKEKAIKSNDPFSPYMMIMFEWFKDQKKNEEEKYNGQKSCEKADQSWIV